jgi:hypothetical protein
MGDESAVERVRSEVVALCRRFPVYGKAAADSVGTSVSSPDALSILRPHGDQGHRFAPCGRGAADPPAPRVPGVYRALHDLRGGGAADADGGQERSQPRALRREQAARRHAEGAREAPGEPRGDRGRRWPASATSCAASASARSLRAASATWSWRSCGTWTRSATCASPPCTAVSRTSRRFAPKSINCGIIVAAASPARTSCRCCRMTDPSDKSK